MATASRRRIRLTTREKENKVNSVNGGTLTVRCYVARRGLLRAAPSSDRIDDLCGEEV